MPVYRFKCSNSHVIELEMSVRRYETFLKQCRGMHKVCPQCKPDNIQIAPEDEGNFWNQSKKYQCRHGHNTEVSAFANGMLHVRWGDDPGEFENFDVSVSILNKGFQDGKVKCRHVLVPKSGKNKGKPRICNCKIKPIDDTEISIPSSAAVKTSVRLGDWWDKQGIVHEHNVGDFHPKTGEYQPTKYEKLRKRHIKKLKKNAPRLTRENTRGSSPYKASKKHYKRHPGQKPGDIDSSSI